MICGMTAYTTWEREQMKNYLREIFSDILLSIVTKKYGTSLNDYQREEKADEIIQELHDKNTFTVEMTQALIDKKGFNTFYTSNIGGTPVYALVKEGMFHKVKICYFITRNKDTIDGCEILPVTAEAAAT